MIINKSVWKLTDLFFYKQMDNVLPSSKPYILFGGDIMEHLDLISLIGNTGFPIAITAYLLIRLEKQLTSLSNSINTLNTIVSVKLGAVVKDEKDIAA